ncbi:MAG TPA: virulence factor [Staphylococcus sp.]|uniref:Conserved virulence factor C n=1 Tax=Mammaliicoccus vitulinus TaxID=71237 RepID=A0ABX7HF57_9STAP|nr:MULTISPECIES: virulence factor [Mammaliicoccus]HAL09236.1 virulence factor [Staphylococcus sp.]MBM6630269.1 virulence factor [Mammaliicoccus vitulinus]MBO3077094.1 virulence factor [Mammaliicoccus vitulinus]MEB7656761.1 virulence factor [Mammaliicoccus vitulinus]PNZ33957.1 virulence factor [Mammaliicoccus vitulinus]
MEIVRVEPTPSPNTMKIILSFKKEDRSSKTYTEINDHNPEFINRILQLEGVKSVFHVMDFIAVDKRPKENWDTLLKDVTAAISGSDQDGDLNQNQVNEHFGEVKAEVLKFKGIPYQIKLTTQDEEKRKQLPEIYIDSMLKATKDSDNVVFLRKWDDLGVRYGEVEEVLETVQEEILALYPKSILDELVEEALTSDITIPEKQFVHVDKETFEQEQDWKVKLRMLNDFPTPTEEDYPLLEAALNDDKPQVRRMAIVLLGMIETKETLPYLYKGMKDKVVSVRRTAGDCLSDLGFKEALPVMIEALEDPQKIVRWRAAMFIFDEGDETALEALKNRQNDPAFDVKLQVEMAIERIENGEAALGSVWKQMANRKKEG